MASKKLRLLEPFSLRSLTDFLRTERANLSRSPVLLVSSEPDPSVRIDSVAGACRNVDFLLAKKLAVRTVPSKLRAAFATRSDLRQTVRLAQRTGASSVVAVGSGAAIDLAKALLRDPEHSFETAILVPSTPSAMLAAFSPRTLLLDNDNDNATATVEQALVPFPPNAAPSTDSARICVAPLESSFTATVSDSSVLSHAAAVVALDTIYRLDDRNRQNAPDRHTNHPTDCDTRQYNLAETVMERVMDELQQQSRDDNDSDSDSDNDSDNGSSILHHQRMSLMMNTGSLVSFGTDTHERSIPMALTASLLPTVFPHVGLLSFWASLAPGICSVVREQTRNRSSAVDAYIEHVHGHVHGTVSADTQTDRSRKIPSVAPSQEYAGFSIPDVAKSHIKSNQALWNCLDVPDSVLLRVLQESYVQRQA